MSALTEDLEVALAEVMAENERGLLARAVVVVEVLDEEGERTLSVLTTPGLPDWDALGMCRFGVLSIENPAGFNGEGE
ncbi:hypothetical protein [Streptomyces sp. NPDC090026]|uniref:hypothetical protein n=1 Tax=Streptomyces sp. NPDC090026 TaxID=3365923 RepID=UPI003814E306